jgi:transposase-like protein
MDTHKNARLTFARRLEMVRDITERLQSVPDAAAMQGVTAGTARKWLGRFLVQGDSIGRMPSLPARWGCPRARSDGFWHGPDCRC